MSTKTKTEADQLELSARTETLTEFPARSFNGVNSNYIPPRPTIVPVPEMDMFDVDETELEVVVTRKKRESSVDLGTVDAYSLRALRANGIDPASLNIHTSPTSRLSGMADLDKFSSAAEQLLTDSETSKTE